MFSVFVYWFFVYGIMCLVVECVCIFECKFYWDLFFVWFIVDWYVMLEYVLVYVSFVFVVSLVFGGCKSCWIKRKWWIM